MIPAAIDLEKLLKFFRDLFAHAGTLTEMMERQDELDLTEETYRELSPKHDKTSEQQFRIFFQALNEPEAFAKAVRDLLSANPKSGPVH